MSPALEAVDHVIATLASLSALDTDDPVADPAAAEGGGGGGGNARASVAGGTDETCEEIEEMAVEEDADPEEDGG